MPVSGPKLSIDDALALCRVVGFTRDRLITAVAVMTAESGRFVEAYNINAKPDGVGGIAKSLDRGLFQINTVHRLGIRASFEALPNARFAAKLSQQGADWSAWMTFVNGKHLEFMDEIQARWEADDWRLHIPKWREAAGREGE